MRMMDIIAKKRDAGTLSGEEIAFFVRGCTGGEIPDYQASALLMAIYLRGMDAAETAALTLEMAHSGDMVDLSTIPGVKVDKHSTGGVGDKTTLVVGPLVASLGVPVAKMSGRGLGHTGGTVDKLESIPGYRTSLSREEFLHIVRETGISLVGQSGNLAPADKKLYALRDVTATVENISLIAASIMSKKIAAGADAVVLDVKTGSGAFMKTLESARALAEEMVGIGESVGRATVALITNMDTPLGNRIGNALEVIEAAEALQGLGPEDLTRLSVELAANMLLLAGKGTLEACRGLCEAAIRDGSAFEKLLEMVRAHGGDASYLSDPERFPRAPVVRLLEAPSDGWITRMDCARIGTASMLLGAGRETKDSPIDYSAGITLLHKTGDPVKRGQPIAQLHTSSEERAAGAQREFLEAVEIGPERPAPQPFVYARVDRDSPGLRKTCVKQG